MITLSWLVNCACSTIPYTSVCFNVTATIENSSWQLRQHHMHDVHYGRLCACYLATDLLVHATKKIITDQISSSKF